MGKIDRIICIKRGGQISSREIFVFSCLTFDKTGIICILYNFISESGCCNPISYLKRNTARTVVQAVSDATFLYDYSNQSGLLSFKTSISSLSGIRRFCGFVK